MAKYDITYICGHEGRVNIIGPLKNRQRTADRYSSGLCPDCYRAKKEEKRKAENQKSSMLAREQELPELLGSLKQVSFAETCRQKLIAKFETFIEFSQKHRDADPEFHERFGISIDDVPLLLQHICLAKRSAGWWIDRYKDIESRRLRFADLLKELVLDKAEEEKVAKSKPETPDTQISKDEIARPEKPKTEMIIDLRIVEKTVEVHYPTRRDDLYDILKKSKFSWEDGRWYRTIIRRNGTVEDRAAEIGHRLLSAGFIIRTAHKQVLEKAVSGQYQNEVTNWVTTVATEGHYRGWFMILWDKSDDYYSAARRITGSRYARPSVVVSPEYFEEVLDFAQKYGFNISVRAKELAEQASEKRKQQLLVDVPAPKAKESVTISGKPPLLEVPSEVEIDETFRDDDSTIEAPR